MRITFDSAKDTANVAKHGVSIAQAEQLDWDRALISPDDRQDYGELRQIALAPMGGRLWVAVFTDRLEGRRVISLRKANLREYRHYDKQAP